ncbi:RDD family protein [Nocardiopsis sp. RSe5-2]|uniref:RDD family protein n=1 Tax=Nocardiopsis endophytica TaxID=3018445 RepID=A0ABT4TZW6_9ACTN|nr:RDD family protein [Nocardiopsis endophytica]MDA2810233.1 RDD family protein [Nocardiopsis endophytica]
MVFDAHGPPDGREPLVTGDAVVLDLRPAGFATRLVALGIDIAVQGLLLLGVVLTAFAIADGVDPAATTAVSLLLMVLIMVGYPVAFETATRGRSLGKMALGLRVVGSDGSPERFRQALVRGLIGAIEIWTLSGMIALISSILDRDGRRVGDFAAGTLVVSERSRRTGQGDVPMPPHLAEWAAAAELSGLDPDTAAMARQYVLRFGELTPHTRHEMGVRIAGLVASRVGPPPPPGTTPPDYLAAVLAERRRREAERLTRARSAGTPPAQG